MVATFLFIYFLDPILRFAGNAFLSASSRLSQAYTDQIYARAAHLDTAGTFSFALYTLTLTVIATFPLGFTVGSLSGYLSVRRSVLGRGGLPRFDEAMLPRKGVWPHVIMLLLAVLLMGVTGANIFSGYVRTALVSTFERHMRVLAPHISEDQRKRIVSEWSLMENEADFDRIQAQLKALAEHHDIQLPEDKIY